ncbi:MAG: HAD family phosphatase [Bacteroidales bacterium]|nr:HAD family phosphatase [Bacteroidales bacterium]
MDHTFSEDREIVRKGIAFFDLDKTIIREISGRAIIKMAWKQGLIPLIGLFKAFYLYILFKLGIREPLNVIDDMVGWVKGKHETELEQLCSDAFRESLLPSVFEEAKHEINVHKENNIKVIILSSALNYICRAMADELGMDGYICSVLESKEGYFTGRPVGRLCFGAEKLDRLIGYCASNNISHTDIWYYADSISDLPVLNSVGNPVCVNPDRELRAEALKRGWKIVNWEN